MEPELPAGIAAVCERAVKVAQAAPEAVAAALVGSWARGRARPDSDVDIVLLTDRPEALLLDDRWHRHFGSDATLVRTADFGAVQEQRLRLPSGLEVEVCVGRPSWAETAPVDPGTKRVVADGMRALWDPQGRLAALADAVRAES